MNDFFDNQQIIQVIRKRFIHFVVIGVAAVLLSALFSSPLFIKPKFKSTARIYPINLAVMSTESETEQMLEIINSNDIKLKMFDAFKLDEVYKIDKKDPQYMTYMLGEYNTNVSTKKTEFETVELNVLDQEPARASQMCDSIIRFYNKKVREMHSSKNWEMVKIAGENLKIRGAERDSLIAVINAEREKYGILDYKAQAKEVTRGYMDVLSSGRDNSSGGHTIKKLFDNLSEKGGDAFVLEDQLENTLEEIDSIKVVYDKNLSEAKKDISYCFVVEKPFPADKKAYPVRWLIVTVTTIASLFLGLLLFILLDYKKEK